jgi:manganese transport protein
LLKREPLKITPENISDHSHQSLSEVHESVDTRNNVKGWRKILSFLGPAYLVSVGYMDPGNWATDLQGGARFGYSLLWVLIMSNLMALLLQGLSARLGIVRRRDLAQANREIYPRPVNLGLYILAEIAIAACDLAEVLGMALGIHLLTGLPILWGVTFTILDTLLILFLQNFGIRKLEAFIIALVIVIGASFVVELFLAKPRIGEVLQGFKPGFLTNESLYIAVGIIGATVMPHNLYLHSALVQTRKITPDKSSMSAAIRFNLFDTAIALNVAFFVNAAILILAATVFFKSGNTDVARIEDAHRLLAPLLGTTLAPMLFAIALIAAGQSSTITGTLAGQIVMEGYLKLRINPWLRRLLTRLIAVTPAFFTIYYFGDNMIDSLLILSQVILSLQLGFAVIPLIFLVSDKKSMGDFAIGPWTRVAAWTIASILVYLNVNLVIDQLTPFFQGEGNLLVKFIVGFFCFLVVVLFLAMTLIPLFRWGLKKPPAPIHGDIIQLQDLHVKPLKKIAVALDFTTADEKLIAYALDQGKTEAGYLLIHVVESASAKFLGATVDDQESRRDEDRLRNYTEQLLAKGYKAKFALGYNNRVTDIISIVKENEAGLLVMGAHRHTGIKDYIFGQTIEGVRHGLDIPVLIINV